MAVTGASYTTDGATSTTGVGTSYACAISFDTDKVLLIGDTATGLVGAVAEPNSDYVGFSSIGTSYPMTGSVGGADYIDAVAVSTTTVHICYRDSGDSNAGYVVVASISGTVVTFGTPVKILTGTFYPFGLDKLDTDKSIIAYANGSTNCQAVAVTNSGTVATAGTPFTYYAANNSVHGGQMLIQAISTTQALVLYYTASSNPTAQVLDISGTTVTGNTPVVDSSVSISGSRSIALTYISATKFLISVQTTVATQVNFGIISVSGTTPSFSAYSSGGVAGLYLKVAILSSSLAICNANATDLTYLIDISGATVSVLDSASTTNQDYDLIPFSTTRALGVGVNGAVIAITITDSVSIAVSSGLAVLAEAGVGEQIEISSLFLSVANFANTNLYLNGTTSDDLIIYQSSSLLSPLKLPNSPIVLTAGEKLYCATTVNVTAFGLVRS